MDTNKNVLKHKTFTDYEKQYFRKLREPDCLISSLNELCGGWFLQTFKQVINKLSINKSSPLPLVFPDVDSMEMIKKNKGLLGKIFAALDTRGIGRIDACELYCALMVTSKGTFESYLMTVVEVFSFESPGRISKNEFFFFLDSLFRILPKILVLKGYDKPIDVNARLNNHNIDEFVSKIFGNKQSIERNQIYQQTIIEHRVFLYEQQLSEFLKYIQHKCTISAELGQNQTIERLGVEVEIKGCMMAILDKVQLKFRNHQFERILE